MNTSLSEEITICIPTWGAAEFIDETLNFARNQDYENIRILVSVDKSPDETLDICLTHARDDDRVRVFEQAMQLGWTRNINFLLEQVETPYYAIYFHDDLIETNWLSTLYERLIARPDAGAAFCAVRQNERLDIGEDYDGDVFQRLLLRSLGAKKGSPLRALTRARIGPVRFPDGVSQMGFNAQFAYLISLISKAPMVYCPEALYQRWSGRQGGVTHEWKTLDTNVIASDVECVANSIEATIKQCVSDPVQLEILSYAQAQFLRNALLSGEKANGYKLKLPESGLFAARLGQEGRDYLEKHNPELFENLRKLENNVQSMLTHRENGFQIQ